MKRKINYKWIAKQLRHEKWGKYRYSKEGHYWIVEQLLVGDFSTYWKQKRVLVNEIDCIRLIADRRSNRLLEEIKHKRKTRNKAIKGSKRRWKYIP